jgi:hypothetical protein
VSRYAPASPPLLLRLRRHIVLLLLLAGGAGAVLAADTLFTNHDGSSLGTPGKAIASPPPAKRIPLPATARRTAVAFVKSTVFRQDLAKGWTLVDHSSSVAAGFTRRRFLSGAIPVVPFPVGSAMRYRVVHAHPRDVMLEVILEPPAGRPEKATVFLLGEQRAASAAPWRVTYWSPRPAYGVPSS